MNQKSVLLLLLLGCFWPVRVEAQAPLAPPPAALTPDQLSPPPPAAPSEVTPAPAVAPGEVAPAPVVVPGQLPAAPTAPGEAPPAPTPPPAVVPPTPAPPAEVPPAPAAPAEVPPAPAPPPTEVPPAPVQATSPPGSLDFDLFGDRAAPTVGAPADPSLAKEVTRRRSMLETHQVLGLTTLGVMATSVVLGQLNYSNLYGDGGDRSGDYLWPHRITTYATVGLFAATAAYSLLAPVPYEKKFQLDTAAVHKMAVIGATAGMLTQAVLGFITARTADAGNPHGLEDKARIHQVVGYGTLGFMTIAAAVWIF